MLVNNSDHDPYFVQVVDVNASFKQKHRLEFLAPLCLGKKILHVGFVDWPITDPKHSLHLQLSRIVPKIDGFDVNQEGAEMLHVPNGKQYFKWDDIPDEQYDIILCTEVIEHVDNVKDFLQKMDRFGGDLVITAPCAYSCRSFFEQKEDAFYEVVHPDHNVWYSPYTLKNTIEKYSSRKVTGLYFINHISIAAIAR